MAKQQGEGGYPQNYPPPPRADMHGMMTLGGVVVLLMISFANWREIDRIQENLDRRLDKIETEISQVGSRAPAPAAAPRRGPDPNRVYTVKTAGAPVRGPARAPITIAEFSDFQ